MNRSGRWWIRAPLISFDPVDGAASDGGLVVAGNTIEERIPAGGAPTNPVDHELDARDCVLLPGLINTHHHFYQTLTRAYRQALGKPLFEWLTALYPVWRHLTPAMIDVSTRLACAELLLSGCTTSVDHHYVFPDGLEDAVDLQAAAAGAMGLRVVLTRGSMSLGERDGGLPPDAVVQDDETILADSERLIARWHDPAPEAMCQVALAPCSPFSVRPELLRDTATLAARHDVGLHTHLAETEDENTFCLERFGRRPLEHLEACGWLDARTWLAHGIHFTAAELTRLGTAGVGIAHCPSSNMFLGSGICPVAELEAAGANVGIGVDGSASNDSSNMIQEVRQAMLLQRLRAGLDEPAGLPAAQIAGHEEALAWATTGGARLLRRNLLGRLAPGSVADLALFSLRETRFSGADDPLAALLTSGAHQAAHVMVNGEWRVLNGSLANADLEKLMARHRAEARHLTGLVTS